MDLNDIENLAPVPHLVSERPTCKKGKRPEYEMLGGAVVSRLLSKDHSWAIILAAALLKVSPLVHVWLFLLMGFFASILPTTARGAASILQTKACFATPDGGTTVISGEDASPVQTAVDLLGTSGGTVLIAGTCMGVFDHAGTLQTVYVNAPITLRGGYDASDWNTPDAATKPTVLDATGMGSVIKSSAPLTIENITITNGRTSIAGGGLFASEAVTIVNSYIINNETTDSVGGGLYVARAPVVMNNTHVLSNTAAYSGGGMLTFGETTVTNSRFENNESKNGDGGALFTYGELKMTGSYIFNNLSSNRGGGIYATGAATIVDSHLENNESMSGAGAVYADSALEIAGTHVLNNRAKYPGGGIWGTDTTSVTNSFIVNNETTEGSGGGLYVELALLAVTNTHVLSNIAAYGGGGVFTLGETTVTHSRLENNVSKNGDGGALSTYGSSLGITNTYILKNTAKTGGGGVSAHNGTATLFNSLIVSNTAARGGGIATGVGGLVVINSSLVANHATVSAGAISTTGGLDIANSIVWDNRPNPLLISGSGITICPLNQVVATDDPRIWRFESSIIQGGEPCGIDADPLFVRSPGQIAGDVGDLRLRPGSPAIDAGNDDRVPTSIITDLKDSPRFINVPDVANNGVYVVDMGPYEFSSAQSQVYLPVIQRD